MFRLAKREGRLGIDIGWHVGAYAEEGGAVIVHAISTMFEHRRECAWKAKATISCPHRVGRSGANFTEKLNQVKYLPGVEVGLESCCYVPQSHGANGSCDLIHSKVTRVLYTTRDSLAIAIVSD